MSCSGFTGQEIDLWEVGYNSAYPMIPANDPTYLAVNTSCGEERSVLRSRGENTKMVTKPARKSVAIVVNDFDGDVPAAVKVGREGWRLMSEIGEHCLHGVLQ